MTYVISSVKWKHQSLPLTYVTRRGKNGGEHVLQTLYSSVLCIFCLLHGMHIFAHDIQFYPEHSVNAHWMKKPVNGIYQHSSHCSGHCLPTSDLVHCFLGPPPWPSALKPVCKGEGRSRETWIITLLKLPRWFGDRWKFRTVGPG